MLEDAAAIGIDDDVRAGRFSDLAAVGIHLDHVAELGAALAVHVDHLPYCFALHPHRHDAIAEGNALGCRQRLRRRDLRSDRMHVLADVADHPAKEAAQVTTLAFTDHDMLAVNRDSAKELLVAVMHIAIVVAHDRQLLQAGIGVQAQHLGVLEVRGAGHAEVLARCAVLGIDETDVFPVEIDLGRRLRRKGHGCNRCRQEADIDRWFIHYRHLYCPRIQPRPRQ